MGGVLFFLSSFLLKECSCLGTICEDLREMERHLDTLGIKIGLTGESSPLSLHLIKTYQLHGSDLQCYPIPGVHCARYLLSLVTEESIINFFLKLPLCDL